MEERKWTGGSLTQAQLDRSEKEGDPAEEMAAAREAMAAKASMIADELYASGHDPG
ncbi:hypothetical protein [Paenibacillus ehimensis]|uniref:Uncharacterized protein n=1 Tax=Paenibacillus ehimensis TaxID=79264 RepID=A0ABT8VA91_9BACL|nr:hypothetical protein [Paenibacillus ehimensis]MDO3677881.1 hypothetical protein [Paenibacillus ehimensis]